MEFESKTTGNVIVVKPVDSRVDARCAADLKDRMSALVAEGHQHIVLDLSAVSFVDSSGLGAIVASRRLLGGTGDLVLCGVQDSVRSLFKLTRMDKVIRIVATEADGVAALTQS